SQAEDDVAGFDPAAIDDFGPIHHANDAACEIVFSLAIHPGHLRSFAPQKRAARSATGARKAAKQLPEHAGLKFFATDVIEEEKRIRAQDGDVVYAMIYEIRTNGVVFVHRERDFQLRADAIDARDQHRLAYSGKTRAKWPPNPANLPEHLRAISLPNERANAALEYIAKIDINARADIPFFHGHTLWDNRSGCQFVSAGEAPALQFI